MPPSDFSISAGDVGKSEHLIQALEEHVQSITRRCRLEIFSACRTQPLLKSHFKDSAEQCPICYEQDYEDGQVAKVIKIDACSHIFHRPCLAPWLETLLPRPITCPMCRCKLDLD
ncbi:hypothetical protein P154DRAFT_192390 [Amniculicola lignicola CBS 123094]|uniref:RING-type domain-containing protein n=1 Tax=Amniculicola lignicola CBS 123094 TaxID=1392246 RepID=A0A6A5WGA7_9PLEO|nr:hypothetical protein P154DRAFT_192390 [Amniculicola lignicola CBS 123094]